jgi:hypothetical protein
MKIKHPAVKSDVFKLVSLLEFDLEVGGKFFPARVELFQDTEHPRHWRCRLWERELCHLTFTLRRGSKSGKRIESDEEVLIERTWVLSDKFEGFEAARAGEAMKRFIDALKEYLQRVTA